MSDRQRIVFIDMMVGIAMILVILGHQLFPFMPEWYHTFHYYIYTFHMPLFIFLSGFLVRYTYKYINNKEDYISYVRRKAIKFIPFYVLIGIICIIFNQIKSPSLIDLKYGAINLLINPYESDSRFLWYVYLLLIYYIISPFLYRLPDIALLIFGVICYVISRFYLLTNILCLQYFLQFTIFFILGSLAAKYIRYASLVPVKATCIIIAMTFIFFSCYHLVNSHRYIPTVEVLLAFSSIGFFYIITLLLTKIPSIKQGLTYISKNCFGIYLWHLPILWCIAYVISFFIDRLNTSLAIVSIILNTSLGIFLAVKTHKFASKHINKWFQ